MKNSYEAWVCEDCYSIHHFGMISEYTLVISGLYDPAWDADNSETARLARAEERNAECVAAYIGLGGDRYVSDNTDSNTGEGIHEYSTSSCDCCGSRSAGHRYRLQVEEH